MGEFFKFVIHFFHGWRRKTGLVTLLMACLVNAMWIRSFSRCDGYMFLGDDPAFHLVYSVPNWIGWVLVKNENGSIPLHYRRGNTGRKASLAIPESDRPYALIYGPVNSEHELAQAFERGPQWCLPYWFLVIPLTLISFWLLLSKPRKSIQKKTAEPTAIAGT